MVTTITVKQLKELRTKKPSGVYALGRMRAGKQNKTEADYDSYLNTLKISGKILWYKFDCINLRLADNTFYKVDFLVLAANGLLELHEVKGYWLHDAKPKFKIAVDMYPFVFVVAKKKPKKDGGGWSTERF